MKVGMVSPFRVQCGNAQHTENLVIELVKQVDSFKIFAENVIPPETEIGPINKNIHIDYERCWQRGQGFEILERKIKEYSPNVIHIQFVGGLFNELSYDPNSAFQKIIENLRNVGIKIILYMHDVPEYFPDEKQIYNWYKNLQAIFFVANPSTKNGIKKWFPEAQVYIIPLGTPNVTITDKLLARQKLGLNEKDFILMQPGFYGKNKGMKEIIDNIQHIHIPNFKMVFAGTMHPFSMDLDKVYMKECIKSALKVKDRVIFVNKFLTKDEIDLYCSAADFFISNQSMIFGYAGTASVHGLLPFGKPLILSTSPKLSAFTDNVDCKKFAPNHLVETIMDLYTKTEIQKQLSNGALELAEKTSCKNVSKQCVEIYNKVCKIK